jgi:quercetin dioxygenase-like cupin family protein
MNYAVTRAAQTVASRSDQPWGSLTWVASRELCGAPLTLGRVVIKRGDHNPRHAHPNCDEVLLLLSGRLEHSAGDEKVILEPGDAIRIPAGVYHNAVSIGESDADMIVAFSAGDRSVVLEAV